MCLISLLICDFCFSLFSLFLPLSSSYQKVSISYSSSPVPIPLVCCYCQIDYIYMLQKKIRQQFIKICIYVKNIHVCINILQLFPISLKKKRDVNILLKLLKYLYQCFFFAMCIQITLCHHAITYFSLETFLPCFLEGRPAVTKCLFLFTWGC